MRAVVNKILTKLNLTEDSESYDDINSIDNDEEADYSQNDYAEERVSRKKKNYKDDYDDLDEEEEDEEPVKKIKPAKSPSSRKGYGKVMSMKGVAGATNDVSVYIIKPTNFNELSKVADLLLDGMPVLLNLEGLEPDMIKRIADFTFGAVYSLNGSIEEITGTIILATPSTVPIEGDLNNVADKSNDTYTEKTRYDAGKR